MGVNVVCSLHNKHNNLGGLPEGSLPGSKIDPARLDRYTYHPTYEVQSGAMQHAVTSLGQLSEVSYTRAIVADCTVLKMGTVQSAYR